MSFHSTNHKDPNFRKLRIALIIVLSFIVFIGIFHGCSNRRHRSRFVNADFQKFTTSLFKEEVSSNSITLHYTLLNPLEYGIKKDPASLGSYNIDTAAASASIENCLAALDKFNYDKLSEKNQLTYDILKSYLETSLDGAAYSLYEEPLSPLTGIQAQLPVLLSEYQLHTKNDIRTYLQLLKKTPEYFQSLCSLEKQKSKAGLFMASYTADAIIKECQSFLALGDNHYLYSSFEQRLEAVEGLTEEERTSYTEQNRTLITDSVFPSYTQLQETLTSLRTTGKNNNGLCYYPDGAAYYEHLVKQGTGSDRSISELQDLTRSQMSEDLVAMQAILAAQEQASESPEPAESEETDTGSPDKTAALETAAVTLETSDPAAILEELKAKLNGSFPTPPEVTTNVKYVQKEMEEFLSPAFYMVPALDNTGENVIYINQGHLPDDLDLYTTLAHEGYPGHLYQTVYFASQNPDPIRSILNFSGYTEGWATYSEMLSYYYTSLPKDQATLMQHNTSVILGLYALADMGIHSDGWTLVDTVAFFRGYGITDNNTIENIYDLIIADPGNYLKYYIGYVEFLELKKDAVEQWGTDFTQKRFHKEVLDIGPAPFRILRSHMLDK